MATTIALPTTPDWYSAIVDHWCAKHAEATEWLEVEDARTDDTLLRVWVSYDEDAEGSPFVLRFDESWEANEIAWAVLDLADDPDAPASRAQAWEIAQLCVTGSYRWAKARGLVS